MWIEFGFDNLREWVVKKTPTLFVYTVWGKDSTHNKQEVTILDWVITLKKN